MLRNKYRLAIAFLFAGLAVPAFAASASELLEKAIYTEETVGDVDAAVKLYEQVVTESKAARKLGAQAQYRLGQCYLKKKDKAKAKAAFEALIKEYPEEKDLVAKARKHVPDELELGPEPWVDGEVLTLAIKLPSGMDIGTFTYTVESTKVGKQDAWRVEIRRFILAGGNNQGISRVDVDRKTFRPIRSYFKHTILGTVDAVYRANEVEVMKRTEGGGGGGSGGGGGGSTGGSGSSSTRGAGGVGKKTTQEGPVYDNEQAMQLFRRLPLAVGYKVNSPIFVPFGGGNLPVGLEVTGIETVETPAGKFECFKVELSIKQTLWFSKDAHRYIVKFEADGVSGELASIQQRKPGEPNTFADKTLGITLTTPHGWLFYKHEDGGVSDTVFLLDPEAEGSNVVDVTLMDKLKPEQKKSVRAWAESQLGDTKKHLKDFKIREDTWQERKVSGKSAVSVLADFAEGKRKMTAYGVFVLGESNAVAFKTKIERDRFDAFRPAFDSIVESCTIGLTKATQPAARVTPAQKREAGKLAAQGWKLWVEQKFDEAEKPFERSVALDPTNTTAWSGLGWTRFHLRQSLNAADAFEKCIALDPKNAGALNGLGWIAKGAGRTKEAIVYWEKAVASMPNGNTLKGLVSTYMEQKKYDQAAKYYQMWLEAEPNSADAKAGLEKAKSHMKDQPKR